jgi:hypothetical protein
MPILQFLLTSNSFAYSAEKDSEEWILVPDAVFQRNYQRFEVLLGADTYDGFDLECSVTIKQRTPNNLAWADKLAHLALQASNGKLDANIIDGCVGTIALGYSIQHHIPPHFKIIVLLPADAIFRIQEYLEKYTCYLSLETDPFEAGLIHGDDPDGNDIRWLVDKVEVAIAKSMSLQLKPR